MGMTQHLVWAIAIAALGGFLFGYNTSVIAGALPFLANDLAISLLMQGVIVSMILIGALVGSLMGGGVADRFGRRVVIFVTAVILVFGCGLTMGAEGVKGLLIGRFITGFGVGLSSVVAPLYLAEISFAQRRGAVVSLYQLAITLGILVAYLVNYACASGGEWRLMFGLGALPALAQLLSFAGLPESPSWLLSKGSAEKANSILKRLYKSKSAIEELSHPLPEEGKKKGWRALLKPSLLPVLCIGIVLSIFQQITGINAVIYYAPQVFSIAGFASISTSILATIGIGIINLLATLLSVWLIDRMGRRTLFIVGLIGMAISLSVLALAFFTESKAIDLIAVVSLMIYVCFFAISLGPLTWVVISEIYPLGVRGRAMSIAIGANWAFNYLVSLTFPSLISGIGGDGVFSLYACTCLLGLWFVYRYIPETRGKSLKEIQHILKI
jgi:SP family galactose:H+ symporter-like MFS transporter